MISSVSAKNTLAAVGNGPGGARGVDEDIALDIPANNKPARISWQDKVEGDVWNMIAADGKLFVVTTQGGIYCFGDDYMVRAYQNTITGNPIGVLLEDDGMIDLGGGSLDVHRWSEPWLPANDYPGTDVAQSWGQNTITGSSSFEVDNNNDLSLTVMAENNFWDYDTVSQVESNEIDGLVDVDPLGIDVE